MKITNICLTFVFATLTAGCSSEPADPSSGTRSRVIGGKDDDAHSAVLGIALSKPTNTGIGLCTATLIAPNLVLTARHCVSDMTQNKIAGTQCEELKDDTGATAPPDKNGAVIPPTRIALVNETAPDGTTFGPAVTKVLVPDGSTGVGNCGHDLALLQLKSAWEGVTPIAPRLLQGPTVGEPLTVVGYGADGAKGGEGVRRILSGASVESVGESRMAGDVLRTTDEEWVIDKGPCAGDSGGPALDASGKVVGVMSRGKQTVCLSMVYQRLDLNAEWIKGAARQAAEDLGTAPPDWAKNEEPTPEPEATALPEGNAEGSAGGCAVASSSPQTSNATALLAIFAAFAFACSRSRIRNV